MHLMFTRMSQVKPPSWRRDFSINYGVKYHLRPVLEK
jgi:hypothetical protein